MSRAGAAFALVPLSPLANGGAVSPRLPRIFPRGGADTDYYTATVFATEHTAIASAVAAERTATVFAAVCTAAERTVIALAALRIAAIFVPAADTRAADIDVAHLRAVRAVLHARSLLE